MKVSLFIYQNYQLLDSSFFFEEKAGNLIATKVTAIFQVAIKAKTPAEADTNLKKIAWLVENKFPVKIKDTRLIFKEKKPEELERYLRLHKKANLFFKDSAIEEKLTLLLQQATPSFKVTSYLDLAALNLYIQELLKKQLLSQVEPILDQVSEKDFPSLTNHSGKTISKTNILNALTNAGLIDQQNHIKLPVGDVSELTNQFGPIAASKIKDILDGIAYRSSRDSILAKTTQSRVLDPKSLSEMSKNAISVSDASLLLSHCIVTSKNKKYSLIDPEKGTWNEGTRNLIKNTEGFTLKLEFTVNPPNPEVAFESSYQQMNEKKEKDFDQHLKAMEVAVQRTEGTKNAANLAKLLENYKHIVCLFLRYSAFDLNIQSYPLTITWELDHIQVTDQIELQKSGLASRRISFPQVARPDLTYFGETNSVISQWNHLKKKYPLDDKWLGRSLLHLYKVGKTAEIASEVKSFLAPLVILLLGKEPAMDRASLLLNFSLLFSMQEGLLSLKEALKLMPMIPQGAVAAKQFLSQIAKLPLDWLAKAQSGKDNERIPASVYLQQTDTFLGSAEEWLQKYDDGITAMINLAVHDLQEGRVSTQMKESLKVILDQLYKIDIPEEELAAALESEGNLLDYKDIVGDWAIDFAYEKMKTFLQAS